MHFKKFFTPLLFPFLSFQLYAQADSTVLRTLFEQSLKNGKSYMVLDHLSNRIGGRLSGSPEAQQAVEYTKNVMEEWGFDRVYLQEVMVPHWVRGKKEEARISGANKKINVHICALGGSVATPEKGLEGKVIEVKDFDELNRLGKDQVEGKIVFFNRPMDPSLINTFHAYGGAVNQRGRGAIEAAKLGAAGVIVRSMSLSQDHFPHTGAMRYDEKVKKIPAAAISTADANLLSDLLKKEPDLKFYYKMNCRWLPDAKSYNVIGELKGQSNPEKIIVVSGHLDSWDLGDGAHDDGAGCVQAMEVPRLFKAAGIRPNHTIRVVLFMNEENGLRGGTKYAESVKEKQEIHLAAIESDAGGFTPRGFGIEGTPEQVLRLMSWRSLLEPYGLTDIGPGHGGADIGPLAPQGIPLIGFIPDSQRYFDYHHAESDTFDKINKRELELGAASMAALVYLIDRYGL